jgi:hypothetical protein
MKLSFVLFVMCVLAFPVTGSAGENLSGNWTVEITAVTPDGTVQTSSIGMTLNPGQPAIPGFYYGLVGTPDAPFITLVQDGKDVRMTISCTQASANGTCDQFMPPGQHRTRTWGTGTATKKEIDLLWSDDIGLTGMVKATRQ